MKSHHHEWEPVIGLEIHTELNTKSKMFSTSFNHFGDEPNSNIDEVCVALPGTLPVINKEAVKKAIQFGCAINAEIALISQFDRKSYFYPDSPRNFQITQFEFPIIKGGSVVAVVEGKEKTFQINRAHLEDDAGMLKHFTSFAGVDYNRAGVPLLEIVSEPCMRSAKDAAGYAMAIKAILEYLDASDCNMDEGSLRIDVNVSVRKKSETGFRNKIEIKNMNSFSNLELAISHEIHRQIELYLKHPDVDPLQLIKPATYRFDVEKNETVMMRTKEAADDYRYFPEPDLLPLVITEEEVNEIRSALPELPLQKEKRFVEELQLSTHQAFFLASDKKIADYFEKALACTKNGKSLANWIIVEFPGRLKLQNKLLPTSGILPEHIAELVEMIDQDEITGKIAKSVADDMVANPGKTAREIVAENPDYRPIHNVNEIKPIVLEVMQENIQSIKDFLAGKDRALAFLIGQIMKRTKGSASPKIVNALITETIEEYKRTGLV